MKTYIEVEIENERQLNNMLVVTHNSNDMCALAHRVIKQPCKERFCTHRDNDNWTKCKHGVVGFLSCKQLEMYKSGAIERGKV